MAFNLKNVNIDILRTPHGLLKLAEMVRIPIFSKILSIPREICHCLITFKVLVFICLTLMRCRGESKFLGLRGPSGLDEDLAFLGIGICVGYAIIVPSTICSYIVSKYEVTFMVNHTLQTD